MPAASEIIEFWLAAGPERWFAKDEDFDAEIRARFEDLHHQAARGERHATLMIPANYNFTFIETAQEGAFGNRSQARSMIVRLRHGVLQQHRRTVLRANAQAQTLLLERAEVGRAPDDAAVGGAEDEVPEAEILEHEVPELVVEPGRAGLTPEQLRENLLALVDALNKSKPSSSKGVYLRKVSLSSTSRSCASCRCRSPWTPTRQAWHAGPWQPARPS